MVGVVDNLDRTVGQGFRNPGDVIYLLGQLPETETASVSLGGSEYLARIHGIIAGQPPVVDGDLEKAVQAAVRQGIGEGWVTAAHDSSEGGLAIALAEACIAGEQGASVGLGLTYRRRDRLVGRLRTLVGQPSDLPREDLLLFGEGGARILCAVDPARAEIFEACLRQRLGQSWRRLGTVGGDELRISAGDDRELIAVRLEEMRDRWANAIERRLAL
jgi:phosphoribosylformylglycinamidine synthase